MVCGKRNASMLKISTQNSYNASLGANQVYSGTSEDVSRYATVKIAIRGTQGASGTIYVGFSPDGTSWSETSYLCSDPSTYNPFVVKVTGAYFRLRFENAGVAQSNLRVQSLLDTGTSSAVGGGAAVGGGSGNQVRQIITLNPTMISDKSFAIAQAPANPANVDFIPYGGSKQRYSVDFDVNSNIISWSGRGLDGFLSSGDVVEITYFT